MFRHSYLVFSSGLNCSGNARFLFYKPIELSSKTRDKLEKLPKVHVPIEELLLETSANSHFWQFTTLSLLAGKLHCLIFIAFFVSTKLIQTKPKSKRWWTAKCVNVSLWRYGWLLMTILESFHAIVVLVWPECCDKAEFYFTPELCEG